MNPTPRSVILSASLFLATLLSLGCYSQKSFDAHAELRRQQLLEMYPPRVTTRKEVRAKWNAIPKLEESRPPGGWDSHPDGWVRSYGSKAEKRIGRRISKLEQYYGADGVFSLCYCWFYYDSKDHLLDAEWQWSSN